MPLIAQRRAAGRQTRWQKIRARFRRLLRRIFKPAELAFYLGQRENSVFPFVLDPKTGFYRVSVTHAFRASVAIVGIALGVVYAFLTSPPSETRSQRWIQAMFMPAFIVSSATWMVISAVVPRDVYLDAEKRLVLYRRWGRARGKARYETAFVRMRLSAMGADYLYFHLVFGARNLPEVPISRNTRNGRVLRMLGKRLAKSLGVNYFDSADLSMYHWPRVPQ